MISMAKRPKISNMKPGTQFTQNGKRYEKNSDGTVTNLSTGAVLAPDGNGKYSTNAPGGSNYNSNSGNSGSNGSNGNQTPTYSAGQSLGYGFNAAVDMYTNNGKPAGTYTNNDKYDNAVVVPKNKKGKGAAGTAKWLANNFSPEQLQSMVGPDGKIQAIVQGANNGNEWLQSFTYEQIAAMQHTENKSTSTPPPSKPDTPQPYIPDHTPTISTDSQTTPGSTRSEVSKKVTDVKTVDNVSTTMSNEVIGWNLPAMDEIIKRFKEISKNFADAELNCKELIPKINEAWSSTYGSVAYDAKLKDGMLKHFAEGADAMDKICGVLEAVETIYREFETKVLAGEYTGDYSEVNGFTVKYSGEAYTNNMTNVLEHKQVIDTTTTTYNTAATTVTSTYRDGTLVNQSTSGGGTTSSTSTSSETVNVNDVGTKTGASVVDAVAKEALLKDSYNKQIYDILVSKGLSDANAIAAVKGYSEILAKTGDGKSVYTLDYVHAENNAKVTKTMRFLTDKTTGQVKLLNIVEKTDKATTITTSSTSSDGGASTVPTASMSNPTSNPSGEGLAKLKTTTDYVPAAPTPVNPANEAHETKNIKAMFSTSTGTTETAEYYLAKLKELGFDINSFSNVATKNTTYSSNNMYNVSNSKVKVIG